MPAPQRVTSQAIIDAYRATGSVWEAAKVLGICGQSVWERLRALDHPMTRQRWSAREVAELTRLIDQDCRLADIAQRLGRPYAGVAGKAHELGLTNRPHVPRPRKVPRGSGLTKPVVAAIAKALDVGAPFTRYCRQHGYAIDLVALAVQQQHPDTWDRLTKAQGLASKVCPNCDRAFFPMNAKQRTCSRRCQAHHRQNQKYFGGKRNEAVGLREGICQLCLEARPHLSAHHVLGKENDPENAVLIALCAGCHHLVGMLARRKFAAHTNGWERLIELVLWRRLGDAPGEYSGTHVAVDIDYLTPEDFETETMAPNCSPETTVAP